MRTTFAPIVAVLMSFSAAAPASAQGSVAAPQPASERRPYRGLFTGLSTARTPQSLVFSASLYGAYDDNVLSGLEEGDQDDWWLQESGYYTGATAGLDYAIARTGRRVDVGAHAGGHVRYYRHEDLSSVQPEFRTGVNLGIALTRSTRLNAAYQFHYAESYRVFAVNPFVDDAVPDVGLIVSDPALDLFHLPTVRNTVSVSLSQQIGRHTTFGLGYGFRSVDFLDDEVVEDEVAEGQLIDYRTQSGLASIQYDRPLSTNATLNLGYAIRVSDGHRGSGEPKVVHDVRAGVSYGRALSFSRRTSFSFSTGSAVTVGEELTGPETGTRAHFRLTGDVELTHEMGRTWTAHANYFRGFALREGFNEPFFTEGASAGIGGLVTRRLSFSAVGMWSLATLQRPGQTSQTSFSATAQSTYALNSIFALFANYVYYKYDTEEDVPLDPRFPRALDRQGVRAGITAAVPLIR
jgi:hypothetical protein